MTMTLDILSEDLVRKMYKFDIIMTYFNCNNSPQIFYTAEWYVFIY